jgi:hypothetical protein
VLISCSTDGDLVQWNTSKGLEQQRLMRLKRQPRHTPAAAAVAAAAVANAKAGGSAGPAAGGKKGEAEGEGGKGRGRSAGGGGEVDAFISRTTGGMSFAFNALDTRVYLAGN